MKKTIPIFIILLLAMLWSVTAVDYSETFESYANGSNATDWVDLTQPPNPNVVDKFHIFDNGTLKFYRGDISGGGIYHSIYNLTSAYSWNNYIVTARAKIVTDNGTESNGIMFYKDGENSYYIFANPIEGGQYILWSDGDSVGNFVDPTDCWKSGVGINIDTWYDFKIQVENYVGATNVKAKIWMSNESEPIDWNINCNDTSANRYTSGTVGFYARDSISDFDYINVKDIGTPINSCQIINNSGTYVLTEDLGVDANGDCIIIDANDVLIDCNGFDFYDTVYDTDDHAFVIGDNHLNITIQNCIIHDWGTGIFIHKNASNVVVKDSTFSDCNLTIYKHAGGDGRGYLFDNNKFINKTDLDYGYVSLQDVSDVIIQNNEFNDSLIDGSDATVVLMEYSLTNDVFENIIIRNNTFRYGDTGLSLNMNKSRNISVYNNLFENQTDDGIMVGKYNTYTGYNDAEIYNNTFRDVVDHAVFIWADNNSIHDNTMYDNSMGILLMPNSVFGHTPENNIIYNNNIYDNQKGVYLGDYTTNNDFFNNNVYNNTVYNVNSSIAINTSGGNYYGDGAVNSTDCFCLAQPYSEGNVNDYQAYCSINGWLGGCSFGVGNTAPQQPIVSYPINDSDVQLGYLYFFVNIIFKVVDSENSILSCDVNKLHDILGSLKVGSNSSVENNTETTIKVNIIDYYPFEYFINCSDGEYVNSSAIYSFTPLAYPSFEPDYTEGDISKAIIDVIVSMLAIMSVLIVGFFALLMFAFFLKISKKK